MKTMREAVIVEAVRTPVGNNAGSLSSLLGHQLGGIVVKEIIRRTGIDPATIDEVYLGSAEGIPGNLGRCVALEAGLPVSVTGVQFDRQCASGLDTICMAAAMIESGNADIIIAGGAESMSNNPYFVTKPKRPYSYAPPKFIPVTLVPEEVVDIPMGLTAENVLKEYPISRERMDEFAYNSHIKALKAMEDGVFDEQIVPVTTKVKGKEVIVDKDESPRANISMEGLRKLKAIFKEGGSVTAGNSCPMNDGASVVLMMSAEKAEELGLKPMLKVKAFASGGVHPHVMGLGPIPALKKLFEKTDLDMDDVELIEFNEAFAAQLLACVDELNLPIEKINPNGGAIALGHPLGATGAVMTTKAAYAMKNAERKYCIVTMCVGGGIGVAALFEKM